MSETSRRDEMEHALTTRFRKQIWSPFLSAVRRYQMALPGDRIAVCLSGGKDSLLLAKCMQTLKKYSSVPFEVVYLSMDPGYSAENHQIMMDCARAVGVVPEVFKTDIYKIVEGVANSPCHVCAAMRRGYLYKEAKKRGCNKIALGHHRDDVAETILLSILYGGQFKTMMPRLKSENYEGMELIRPLYLVREKAIINWLDSTDITTTSCACRVTRSIDGGKRARVKRLLKELEHEQSNIIDNIIASSANVNLATVLSYRDGEGAPPISFMAQFSDEGDTGMIVFDRLF
ncbi:MAG: tRNA 2-thiocytidine biosynthesis protein TtcA [Clostridiales bacterium]|nr:tRNA 2-thiocytidine biosynthesis protein TtcA [Clostridiales bacterium]